MPQPIIVDRTLRYYCAEKEVLKLTFPMADSSSSCSPGGAPGNNTIHNISEAGCSSAPWRAAVADHPEVMLRLQRGDRAFGSSSAQPQTAGGCGGPGVGAVGYGAEVLGAEGQGGDRECQGRTVLSVGFKCGLSPTVTHFHVWLYADSQTARPVEVWQVRLWVSVLGASYHVPGSHCPCHWQDDAVCSVGASY